MTESIPTQGMVDAMVELLDACKATQVGVTFIMGAHVVRTVLVRHSTLIDDVDDVGDDLAHLVIPAGLSIEVKDHQL